MELLDHMESRFGPFGDIVSFGARSLIIWNLASVHLETLLVLVQDRCTVGT